MFRDMQLYTCYLQGMSSITALWSRDELLAHIADWKQALRNASTGKSYAIGSRNLTRYDLPEIRAQLAYYQNELTALESGRRGPAFVRAQLRRQP